MTQNYTLVWKYGQGSTATDPTSSIAVRHLYPSNNPRYPLPLGLLVHTSTEPGLLVVMPVTGKITYWESLSIVATSEISRQRQQSIQTTIGGMLSGETVVDVIEAEPRGFILTLSTGRLLHLSIRDSQGRSVIHTDYLRNPISHTGGVFGSLRNVFGPSSWRQDVAAIHRGTSIRRGQRYMIIATTKSTFQVWDMNWNGSRSMKFETDAKDDILKALMEGAPTFADVQKNVFKILDFTILSDVAKGNEVAKSDERTDCRLMVLIAVKGYNLTRYALVGLRLRNGMVTIEVVHPITCYSTLDSLTEWKPHLYIPRTAETAFVIFEKGVVLMSLVEVEESPTSQLQLESHTLPEPFQDVIHLKSNKSYRVVGATLEHDAHHDSASILVMILDCGVVRVTALPMKTSQSTLERRSISAQTKIEQAVFYGRIPQTPLDFTPSPEMEFTQEEAENAALQISHSIGSSTSKYISVDGPSMEQSLKRRSTALNDLNAHLQKFYPPMSRLVKWKLLWNAEKMASAQVLWQGYQESLKNMNDTTDKRNVFTELVEAIHPRFKIENQPDQDETDGVRHWFVHDIWRLEYLVPYAEMIVELMFQESIEDKEEFDLPTRARMLTEASEIQLAAIETALDFREANAPNYGLEEESIENGVLSTGFEGLPEFWTSIAEITEKTKMMTDVCREIALALVDSDQAESPQDDEDLSEKYSYKLAEQNPRQVEMSCRTYTERYRWLMSREDSKAKQEGSDLRVAYHTIRKELLINLPDLGQSVRAVELAEKFKDMDALAEIIDIEMRSPEPTMTQEKLQDRINSNFVNYGTAWANAYFTRHLEGANAVDILNQYGTYKTHLTKFLRSHEQYAKIAWIHETLAEKDYLRASECLAIAGQQTSNLWTQKIDLSMQKLTLLAAQSKGQARSTAANTSMSQIDGSLESLEVQKKLLSVVQKTAHEAIDAEAAAGLIIDNHTQNPLVQKPAFKKLLRHDLQQLLSNQILPPADVIDLLTILSSDSKKLNPDSDGAAFLKRRFFTALQVLHKSPLVAGPSESVLSLDECLIWRRCILVDDWPALNRTEKKNDSQVTEEMSHTALFQTLVAGFSEDPSFWNTHTIPHLQEENVTNSLLDAGLSPTSLRTSARYSNTPEHDLAALSKEFKIESDLLRTTLSKGRLAHWGQGIRDAAETAAATERQAAKVHFELLRATRNEMYEAEEKKRKDKSTRKGPRYTLGMDGTGDDFDIYYRYDYDYDYDFEHLINGAQTTPRTNGRRNSNSPGPNGFSNGHLDARSVNGVRRPGSAGGSSHVGSPPGSSGSLFARVPGGGADKDFWAS